MTTSQLSGGGSLGGKPWDESSGRESESRSVEDVREEIMTRAHEGTQGEIFENHSVSVSNIQFGFFSCLCNFVFYAHGQEVEKCIYLFQL